MQALIDFDGWRKWKDFAGANKDAVKALPASTTDTAAKAKERKAKRASRASLEGSTLIKPPPGSDLNGSAIATEEAPDET